MKVKELIAELKECNQEDEVVLSCDEEGNSFSSLDKQSIATGYAVKTVVLFPFEEGIELDFV